MKQAIKINYTSQKYYGKKPCNQDKKVTKYHILEYKALLSTWWVHEHDKEIKKRPYYLFVAYDYCNFMISITVESTLLLSFF